MTEGESSGRRPEEAGWLPPVPPGPAPEGGAAAPAPPAAQPPPPSHEAPTQAMPGPAAPTQPGPPPPGWQPPPPGWSQPPPGGWQGAPGWYPPTAPQEPGNAEAVAALVLGIASPTMLLVTLGFSSLVSVACSVAAIFLGRKGKQKVDQHRTRKHRGLAQAGFILGLIGTVLSVLATVGWVLIITSDEFLDEFEKEFERGLESGAAALVAIRAASALARVVMT